MNKRTLIFIIVGIVSLFLGSSGTFWWYQKTRVQKIPSSLTKQEEVISLAKLVMWDDPSGFTFLYPQDLIVNKHDEDQENYAHVELTHPQHTGRIIVWAKDPPDSDIEVLSAQLAGDKGIVLDTVLGGKPGKKIRISKPALTVTTAALYDGLLFTVETVPTDPYWNSVQDKLLESFTFKPIPGMESDEGSTDSYSTPVDEEEVVE